MLQLNPKQHKASEGKTGITLVVAGAGSGKTRIITARIARLITEYNIEPSSIVALTFTNKAAREMKERLEPVLVDLTSQPFVGTFHAYCLKLLRSTPSLLGSQNFSIMDTDDQATLIRRLSKKYGIEKQWSAGKIMHMISALKNHVEGISPELKIPPTIHELATAYEHEKNRSQNLDFDDLILRVYEALCPIQTYATYLRTNVRHLLVDEYQDTNTIKHELLRRIALDPEGNFALDSLCAVGDQDQSIYSWRGAVASNMDRFQAEFSPKLVKVEQNYRSVQSILTAANAVINHNTSRVDKNLWSERKGINRLITLACKNEYHEAEIVAHVAHKIAHNPKKQSIGILYRTHAQSRVLEEAMIAIGLPYVMIGGLKFYERMEVKDILAYLKLINNPFDRISFFRVLNTPNRGLGEATEELLRSCWDANPGLDSKQLIKKILSIEQLTDKKQKSLTQLSDFFSKLDPSSQPQELFRSVMLFTDYNAYLRTRYEDEDATTRIQNVDELARSIEKFEERSDTLRLSDFLHEVALVQDEGKRKSTTNTPQLMTLHSAKGLEFNTVIITGNEEGTFPSSSSLDNPPLLEEERRLFYVGMTRAKDRLLITRAYTRNKYGRTEIPAGSRFITEIPASELLTIDAANVPLPIFRRHITEWVCGNTGGQQMDNKPGIVPAKSVAYAKPKQTPKKVTHPTFGTGNVIDVKKLPDGELCITVKFKSGTKKILSKFLSRATT